LKGDLIFADEEGVPRGHPQALTLVPLGYFLGDMGISKLELLSILHLISCNTPTFVTLFRKNFVMQK
jgi:hypothetical protein